MPMAEAAGSVVGTSTDGFTPSNRYTFYANGLFWVFWSDGTNMVYSTSTNATIWATKTTVRACAKTWQFSIWFDGTYVHYVYIINGPSGSFYYRRGAPGSGGTITWSASEQTVATGMTTLFQPFVSVDTDGYVWVGYDGFGGGNYLAYVIKSGNNDGTWGATPTGFPYTLHPNGSTDWFVQIIPLTSGKMLAVCATKAADSYFVVRAWSGTVWKNYIDVNEDTVYGWDCSAVAEGDVVHIVYLQKTVYNIRYVNYTYATDSLGTKETVQAAVSTTSAPILCRYLATNRLYCFWAGSPTANHIYYKRRISAVWDVAATDFLTETDLLKYNGNISCSYNGYGSFINLVYNSKTVSPYDVRFAFPTDTNFIDDVDIVISNMDAENWMFAEYKYYTFNATYKHNSNWTLIDTMRVNFQDGGDWIRIQYRISTERYTATYGDSKVVIRIISAENVSVTDYRIMFGLYLTKNVVDAYNIDMYAWANSTGGGEFYDLIEEDYCNIYNLGGRTEYKELGDASKSSHPVKSDPFDLRVNAGGNIAVNVTYRNLQQISLLTHLIVPRNYIDSQYAGEWSVEYGVYYYANGGWTRGWNVVLEFSNGFVSNKDYFVFVHARWYRNNGVLVGGSEYFSSFFRPGMVNGTTVWVDLWFSNTNSSTAGGGRVSAEYYGMKDNAPWFAFWYSDWGPMLANQTMSYYEMPLLNSGGGVISTKDVELIKVYSRLYKSGSSYVVEVKSPEVFDRKIAKGDFTGIPTPPFVPPKVMDMPQGGLFGLLQTFLASIVAAITQALSPAFATCVAILDGIFAWAGWPGGFTQITTWISQMAGFMISAMGWMMTMLTGLFGFFTVTVPAMLYVVTSALTIYIDMIGKFWGFFTGLFGTGFDVWNDFGGTQWVTIGIMIYPMYLLLLWTEHGLAPVMVHLDFWGGLIMGLVNIAISLAGMVWSFISGLIENIPVVE
jgi:hypothetical protein